MPKNSGNNENIENNGNNQEEKDDRYYKISHIQEKIDWVEEKYGLKFSCEKYVGDVQAKLEEARNNQEEPDVDTIRKEVFLDTVKGYYKEYIKNQYLKNGKVDREYELNDDLYDDIHEIIHMYSDTKEHAAEFGKVFDLDDEIDNVGKMQIVYDGVKDLIDNPPLSHIETIKNCYKAGNYRIRDMRAFVNGLIPRTMTKEDVATALQSAQALSEVNESRSFLWKVFHPFRNNAEQRDAKYIQSTIIEKIISLQSTQTDKLGIQWYKTFAESYSPLSETIRVLGEDVQEAMDDVSEFGDAAYAEDDESVFDKEDVDVRKSINIELENEEMKLDKSPFIQGRSMSEPLIKINK